MLEWEEVALEQSIEALRSSIIKDWPNMLRHLREAIEALEARCCHCGREYREVGPGDAVTGDE